MFSFFTFVSSLLHSGFEQTRGWLPSCANRFREECTRFLDFTDEHVELALVVDETMLEVGLEFFM